MSDSEIAIIPLPAELVPGEGRFVLGESTRIASQDADAAKAVAEAIAAETGLSLDVTGGEPQPGDIAVAIEPASGPDGERYEMDVALDGVRIVGRGAAGVFYAAQTLRQMVTRDGDDLSVPVCRIVDGPRFAWRGLMLDCSRHFMPVDFVKRMLDQMALLKMNVFHWHFTDDHGWRVEIKRYPRLTEVGGFVEEEEGRRGFYTQDQVREVVAYAAARHIMVVPEIDMPGHSWATMVAYPELCCTGKPERNAGHQKDLYCAGREETFAFIEGVLEEIVDLFPAPFVHIGGDEAPKDRWSVCPHCRERIAAEGLSGTEALQGYFTRRVGEMLAVKGRRLVGWEEIAFNDVAPPDEAVVHWWQRRTRGSEGVEAALARGLDVLSSPNITNYLSFPVDPEGIFKEDRTFDLQDTYETDHVPDCVPDGHHEIVLGGEACVWTEVLPPEAVETMIYPRFLATAERLWSSCTAKDFAEFHERVEKWRPRLDAMGIRPGPTFRKSRSRG